MGFNVGTFIPQYKILTQSLSVPWLFLLTAVAFEAAGNYLSSNVSALSFAFGLLLHQMEACP